MIRFSPDGEMAWTALRSPVPDFGGREADDAEWDGYDEDADNPQYNLIFDRWDAQFDQQEREWKSFVPANFDLQSRFENALAGANELSDIIEQRFSDESDKWLERCKQNLKAWCGDGIRLE